MQGVTDGGEVFGGEGVGVRQWRNYVEVDLSVSPALQDLSERRARLIGFSSLIQHGLLELSQLFGE